MSYNLDNLVKLQALKQLAKRINDDFATKSALNVLDQRIDGLVTAGGEPNKIDVIKVNGTAQEITNKSVDLTIPTKVSDLTNDSNYQTETEVTAAVAAGVAAADHLARTKVTSIDDIDLTAADADKYIYMVPAAGDKTGNKYDEYMVLDGELEKVGDWEVDLSDYVQKEDGKGLSTNDFTNEDKAKLNGIADGATKVEASNTPGCIKINGSDTTVVSIATDNDVGLMLNDIFGAQYPSNFSERYGLDLTSVETWVRIKSIESGFDVEYKCNDETATSFVVSKMNQTIPNFGFRASMDATTGYIVVTDEETGETVDYKIMMNNIDVWPTT